MTTRPHVLLFKSTLAVVDCTVPDEDIPMDTLSCSQRSVIAEEAQYYSLPYGGWGFFSHIRTYYTLIMLILGRKPYPPWSKLHENGKRGLWNKRSSIVRLLVTSIPPLVTIIRCSHAWQFETIAAMKLSLSLTSGLIGIVQESHKKYYALIYFPGAIRSNGCNGHRYCVVLWSVFFCFSERCVFLIGKIGRYRRVRKGSCCLRVCYYGFRCRWWWFLVRCIRTGC